jgi:hypothetical protein
MEQVLYEDERWPMPIGMVQKIMQDESCITLPSLKPLPKKPPPLFYVSLKDMDNGKEYMHPELLDTLQDYQLHFLDCPLLKNVDLTRETEPFPMLPLPIEEGMGPVSMATFTMRCGKTFKVTAVPGTNLGNVVIYVNSPPLPADQAACNLLYPTSMARRACLRHFAMLGIAHGSGIPVQHVVPATQAADQEAMIDAMQMHGKGAVQCSGQRYDILSGVCQMYELEHTAVTLSLPLVLKHLHFLQFNLDQETTFTYHVMAPTKFAYMVRIPNLGGWEIYYQVNMSAPLKAMEFAYAESRKAANPSNRMRIPSDENSEAFISSLFRGMDLPHSTIVDHEKSILLSQDLMKRINLQLRVLSLDLAGKVVSAQPKEWLPEIFYIKMQEKGMEFLKKDILDKTVQMAERLSIQTSRPLLQYLLLQCSLEPIPLSMPRAVLPIGFVLHTMLQAFMGCVGDVYDFCKPENKQVEKVSNFITLLKTTKQKSFASVDQKFLPIILKSCMECPPMSWWERTQNSLLITNWDSTEVTPSVYICTTFLYHTQKFSSYFPAGLFPQLQPKQWGALVSEACRTKDELHKAKETCNALCTLNPSRFRKADPSEEKSQRRYEYCLAVAYLMLRGTALGDMQALQAM